MTDEPVKVECVPILEVSPLSMSGLCPIVRMTLEEFKELYPTEREA